MRKTVLLKICLFEKKKAIKNFKMPYLAQELLNNSHNLCIQSRLSYYVDPAKFGG